MRVSNRKKTIVILAILGIVAMALVLRPSHTIDYISEVKPIFNKHCITCHGGVRRKSGFSLLFRAEALAKNESGKPAIIPGDPDHSEMIRRIQLTDPEDRMPYKHEPLTEKEINTLKSWIRQGAVWGDHWAYLPVKETIVPKPERKFFGLFPGKETGWEKNEIDYFITQKLNEEKIKPTQQAGKSTLLRRLSLDLTGVPPDERLTNDFLKDTNTDAYPKLVDALLASPKFGERWTSVWLDIARYADTKGYEKDDSREIWRYRDWLIRSLNADKPYDVFLTEQIAGDLLKDPTDDQLIATAFQRNSMTNDEGGTDNEEFRTAAVLDRVNTTWQGLMGTTFACVQCHSHPYDPFTHDEYYKFMAFYNNSRDEDTGEDYPLLRHYNKEDSLSLLNIVHWLKENEGDEKANEEKLFLKTGQPAINSFKTDQLENGAIADTKYLSFRNNGSGRLQHVNLQNKNELVFQYFAQNKYGKWTIHLDNPAGPVLKTIPLLKTKKFKITNISFDQVDGMHDLYFTYTNDHLKKDENGVVFDWFRFSSKLNGKNKPGFDSVQTAYWRLIKKKVPTTPVMLENPEDMHRTSNVFERGNWLVKGKQVEPDVPKSLNPFPSGAPRNRLGLAKWLTDKKNPLTARTMVNRLWEQLFGTGLVETLEDMGTQGAAPTHKELLDFLSWQFMYKYNWSVKKLLKEMVMSATYMEDSKIPEELLQKDPAGKLYARFPRVRLSAEQVRDQALEISGLLSEKMYGEPVMPWQPEGIWFSPYNDFKWKKSSGSDQYRRGIYTFLKRTAPYPSMLTFDGTSREVCSARRINTNTPLQALVTMNDSVYVEAARAFAYRLQHENGLDNNVDHLIAKGYQLAMLKPATGAQLAVLKKLYADALTTFKTDTVASCEMIGMQNEHNNPETAALVVVATTILNLDELITKN